MLGSPKQTAGDAVPIVTAAATTATTTATTIDAAAKATAMPRLATTITAATHASHGSGAATTNTNTITTTIERVGATGAAGTNMTGMRTVMAWVTRADGVLGTWGGGGSAQGEATTAATVGEVEVSTLRSVVLPRKESTRGKWAGKRGCFSGERAPHNYGLSRPHRKASLAGDSHGHVLAVSRSFSVHGIAISTDRPGPSACPSKRLVR